MGKTRRGEGGQYNCLVGGGEWGSWRRRRRNNLIEKFHNVFG